MRLIAGAWRGKALKSPPGQTTRPTAGRARQALFDMLMHAPWAGPDAVRGAQIVDAFAGTGALGLEALSRGAARAIFFETDREALKALRANIATCGAQDRTAIAGDPLHPPPGTPATLLLLDPPYGLGLIGRAVAALAAAGWLARDCLVVAECAPADPPCWPEPLADRVHGAARIVAWRQT